MIDIVKIYNPSNASALTPEQIAGLQKLTSDQIKELAKAYPNTYGAYLLIIDSSKPLEKQLPSLSTFQNLWNLREKNGLKKYVAFNFKGAYKSKSIPHVMAKKTEVRDLSDTELLTLPGFKKFESKNDTITATVTKPETVKVTKIKKQKI